MINHPESSIPEDRVQSAYADLVLTLARDEPEALARAAETLTGDASRPLGTTVPDGGPAARLAHAYLAFTGNAAAVTHTEGVQVFTFTYPAHVVFQVVGAGSPKAARRVARRSLGAMLDSDEPVAGIDGPLPGEAAISNVYVWLGSPSGESDVLELEGIDGRGSPARLPSPEPESGTRATALREPDRTEYPRGASE